MPLSFGLLGTYPPTRCGIATFTASLRNHLVQAGSHCGVVRVVDHPEALAAPEVIRSLTPGSYAGQVNAAVALESFDVAVIQHEFGIYGGVDGDDVLGVVDWLTAPVIPVLHTVPTTPSPHQRKIIEQLAAKASGVVVMTGAAHDRLLRLYQVDPGKLTVIPHGANTIARVHSGQSGGSPATMLTWGLLGPGKGIEAAIDAMVELRTVNPRIRYRVVGQTHPRVLARDGERYRQSLLARAVDHGVADMVTFEDVYLDHATLRQAVAEADVVVLPYESAEQVTSGVLIEAVAARRPVVATAFPHAVELLAGGAGLVVPHGDGPALANALRRVLTEPGLSASMSHSAGLVSSDLAWPAVAAAYLSLATRLTPVRTILTAAAPDRWTP